MMTMKSYRIWAVTLRYLRQSTRDLLVIGDFVFWPLIDVVIWGMMSLWLETPDTSIPNMAITIISNMVFWQIVYQANIDITNNLIDELWSQNLINIFSSPLTINEWIAAVMLLGIIRVTFIITLCASFAWMLYSLNIFAIGWMLFPFSLSLLLTGWILGFCTAGLIMHGGMRLNWANWAIGYFISPFIGMYYPVKTLPTWLQCIAYSLPPTYVFEGMRSMMEENIPRIDYMAISLALNVMYLALAIMFFKAMFEKSRARGLARIE